MNLDANDYQALLFVVIIVAMLTAWAPFVIRDWRRQSAADHEAYLQVRGQARRRAEFWTEIEWRQEMADRGQAISRGSRKPHIYRADGQWHVAFASPCLIGTAYYPCRKWAAIQAIRERNLDEL